MSRSIRLAIMVIMLLSQIVLPTTVLAAPPKTLRATISGTVRGSEQAPISGAGMKVYLANKRGDYGLVAAPPIDSNGRWTYVGKGGAYRFEFVAANAEPQTRSLTTADGGVYALDVTLQSYGWLSGAITDGATGAPVSGATVELYRRNDDTSWPSTPETTLITAADGTYGAEVVAGRYAVRASSTDHVTAYYGGTPPPDATPLLVATGSVVTGVDIALTPAATYGTIGGRVVSGADGFPVIGTYVWFYKQNADGTWPATSPGWGSPTFTVITDQFGRYDSGPLAYGNYLVRFYDWHYGSQWWSYAATVDLATVLTLGPGTDTYSGVDGWFNRP